MKPNDGIAEILEEADELVTRYAGAVSPSWGADVWRPICAANPQIQNCRMIFVGDVLRIPAAMGVEND